MSLRPLRIVVLGVAASGKSTVGEAIAQRFGVRYVEADAFHVESSVAKMTAGIPLTDEDRWPWLERLQRELVDAPVVVSCSGLRKAYRDVLRHAGGVHFIFLDVPRDEIERRIRQRVGHFMGPAMVEGQFATLEQPGSEEPDVTTIDGCGPLDEIIERTVKAALNVPMPRLAPA